MPTTVMYCWHGCRVRADRLLSLVLLLRRRGRLSAAVLAAELECSVRTVLRDVEALSAAGVPVYAERGRHGGFALLDGWTTDLTGLTTAEATALFTAGSRAGSTALGLGPAFASAMHKLTAALPEPQQADAERARRRVLVLPDGWLGRADPVPHLPVLVQATLAGRRVRLRYAARDKRARWRAVDPIGLVDAAGVWYLLTGTAPTGRTFRVSRVSGVEVLDEPSDQPVELDLSEQWRARRARFRTKSGPMHVTVRVSREHREAVVAAALAVVAERHAAAGEALLELEFGDDAHAEAVLWRLAPHARVLAPARIVAAVSTRAERTAAVYASTSPSLTGAGA